MRFDRILAAVDFAPASIAALRRAGTLVNEGGALHVLHALDLGRPSRIEAKRAAEVIYEDALARSAREALEKLVPQIRAQGRKVTIDVRTRRAADEILGAAEKLRVDLLVLGTHARGAVGRLILGSVAEEVVRKSPAPVLVVRELAEGGPYVSRVVLAADASEPSREAAQAAVALAKKLDAKLEAIHVLEASPLLARLAGGAGAFPLDDIPPTVMRELGCTVEDDVARAAGEPVRVRFAAGDPARDIAKFAGAGDLLVCGTHGRGVLDRLKFGSVATKLIRISPCPILVVRPNEEHAIANAPSAAATVAKS